MKSLFKEIDLVWMLVILIFLNILSVVLRLDKDRIGGVLIVMWFMLDIGW